MRLPRTRSPRTVKTIGLVVGVVVLVAVVAAAVDRSSTDGVFLKDAALMAARVALPLVGLAAFGLRWGDWRPSGSPLEAERERRLTEPGVVPAPAPQSSDVDPDLDEDFDRLARQALADGLPEPLALALLHDVVLVFADGAPAGGPGVQWQPSVPHPAGGPATGTRVVLYRDAFRERCGHDLALLRAELTRAVRECLARDAGIDVLRRG